MSKFDDRAVRYTTDLIRDFQLEDFQAAGFPGNFGVETGGFEHVQEIDPVGGGRGGLGDAQWTGPRRRAFEAWLARNPQWDARTYEANYSMLFRELVGPEAAALEAVRAARSVDEATEIVMRRFERPGVEHLERRKEYGRQALTAFRARGIDVEALKAEGRPGAPRDGEILPPVVIPQGPQLDLGQLLSVALPVLQQVLANPQAQQLLAPLLGQLFGVKAPAPSPAPAQPVAPSAPGSPLTSPAWWGASITGILGSLGLMANGNLGTPMGLGEQPTLAGNLVPLVFAALPAIGSFLGPVGAAIGRVIGVVGPAILNRQPPQP